MEEYLYTTEILVIVADLKVPSEEGREVIQIKVPSLA
jgi:hypothetical protein